MAIVDPLLDEECPPIGLRHHEPDLDARLRLAAPERRRTILLHLIDVLTERFGLGSAAVTRARRAAHDRLPIDADLLRDVAGEWETLGQRWAGQGTAVREQADDEWRRWVAANGVRHGLRSLNEGASILDGLTYARFALSDEWPGIRAWIRAELRSGLPGSR